MKTKNTPNRKQYLALMREFKASAPAHIQYEARAELTMMKRLSRSVNGLELCVSSLERKLAEIA